MIDRSKQPQIRDLEQLNIRRPEAAVMPNGVSLFVLDAAEQEVIRLDVVVKAGSWFQEHRLQAMFTNRMLREGTRCYPAAQIAERLDYYGAWLELSVTAEYAYITLYSLNKYVVQTLGVLASMLKEPVFGQKELDTVVEVNLQQHMVNLSKVDFLAHRELLRVLHGEKHPLGRLVVPADYRQLTPDLLLQFYKDYYYSANCAVFLSGKVTAEVRNCVIDLFGTESFGVNKPKAVRKGYKACPESGKRFFCEREDALQSAVKLGGLTIERSHPDYLNLKVLMTVFGGYFGSRLMSNIREDKGYTYGISAGILFYPGNGVLLVTAETDNRYVEPLIAEVYHEMDRLQNERVSEEELSMVRNYMLGEMCRNYESSFSLADAWIYLYTAGLDDGFFERSLQSVRCINPDELQTLAQKYLCKETLKEVIAGKKLS